MCNEIFQPPLWFDRKLPAWCNSLSHSFVFLTSFYVTLQRKTFKRRFLFLRDLIRLPVNKLFSFRSSTEICVEPSCGLFCPHKAKRPSWALIQPRQQNKGENKEIASNLSSYNFHLKQHCRKTNTCLIYSYLQMLVFHYFSINHCLISLKVMFFKLELVSKRRVTNIQNSAIIKIAKTTNF